MFLFFFFSSRRRHTRCSRDWSSDVCSSDLLHRRIKSNVQHQRQAAAVPGGHEPEDERADRAHRQRGGERQSGGRGGAMEFLPPPPGDEGLGEKRERARRPTEGPPKESALPVCPFGGGFSARAA